MGSLGTDSVRPSSHSPRLLRPRSWARHQPLGRNTFSSGRRLRTLGSSGFGRGSSQNSVRWLLLATCGGLPALGILCQHQPSQLQASLPAAAAVNSSAPRELLISSRTPKAPDACRPSRLSDAKALFLKTIYQSRETCVLTSGHKLHQRSHALGLSARDALGLYLCPPGQPPRF